MKKYLLVLLALLCIGYSALQAQDNKDEVKEERKQEPSTDMQDLQLAVNLAQYGYANRSALSLIEAARMVNALGLRELEIEKSDEETGNGDVGEKAQKRTVKLETTQLLEDATEFAGDDSDVLAIIEKEKAAFSTPPSDNNVFAGRVYGPAKASRRVSAYSRKIDYILFRGQEWAEVAVIGDGDNDLDLYIYDQNGRLVAKDDDYTDQCYVSFYPYSTASYTIVVKNRGRVYSNYWLLSN